MQKKYMIGWKKPWWKEIIVLKNVPSNIKKNCRGYGRISPAANYKPLLLNLFCTQGTCPPNQCIYNFFDLVDLMIINQLTVFIITFAESIGEKFRLIERM